ncbi:MAG: hypothetical protein PHO07_03085 [Pirellulales bacterium]|jgi:hypothetical protein|nr:hypothetical protein [Thermoguttaceae bacterium]MDD4786132.1 hypothetical protein [Pirellulales bacterium]MDI9443697.1 hypothetical protein [Planctomycetota bacterium]NLZ02053.1 hypothetical protein [Pirellulaceae bacterium]
MTPTICTFSRVAIWTLVAAAAAAEEPFNYFRNDWNVVGLKDYQDGTRITPENRLLLAGKRELEIRVGRNLVPLGKKHPKTLLEGWMPIVLLSVEDGPVRYEVRIWASPLPSVRDWRAAFDWPTEGENYLNFVHVSASNRGDQASEAAFEIFLDRPEPKAIRTQRWNLAPGESAAASAWIPFAPLEAGSLPNDIDAQLWQERTIAYWRELLDGAATIEVPCRKATEALRAAHVCQLIANDHGVLQGGEGFYDEFYIRDGGYQLMELEEAALWGPARKAVEAYLARQRGDGRFESQKDQFDANGQALWVLWQYFQITGDRAWLAAAYPQIRRAADWIIQTRQTTEGPFAGLLPAAPADGEYLWDGKHHIVGYDIWNLRGLLCAADAAGELGRNSEAAELREQAGRYRAAIDAAVRRVGCNHFPPSWELAGTHWGNTETLWPTALFDPDDPRVVATIDHARHVHGGGFIEGTIQWLGGAPAIHPYMSAYTTMASLRRGDHAQVVEDFHWYLLHSTAAQAFPEGVFPQRRFAWSNTIPHVTGASNYALMLRHMLIDERGDELHLLPAAADWWLGEGQVIAIRRAPTHFGEMNLRVRGTARGVELALDLPKRRPPRRTVLHLPASRPPRALPPGVELATRSEQRQRWDFPSIVKRYYETAGPAAQPIPGLIVFPLEKPVDPDRCTTIDVRAVANTDPFTAPFGVPEPGKFLFTGLKTGRQQAGGVPFELIDPQENGGRGLVVLHSPRAPANRQWPTEVRIPVGRKGRRAFFLGNVHGWSSNDPGTGPWGAVAEYVICYADGQRQTVPLVTGRTIDEWTASPSADEVTAGLRGEPWHLNVLGVELRDAPIEAVLFRDLDTPAAPVLAAVTIEE